METCLLKNKKICSFDLVDNRGQKDYELEIIWKIASKKELLRCDECNETVFLRSGDQKIPHFSHKPNFTTDCSKAKKPSSELYLKIKKQIYDSIKGIEEFEALDIDSGLKYDFYFKVYNKEFKILLKKLEEYQSANHLDSIFYFSQNKKIDSYLPKIDNKDLPLYIVDENYLIKIYLDKGIKKIKNILLNEENLREFYMKLSSELKDIQEKENNLQEINNKKKNFNIFTKKYKLASEFLKDHEYDEALEILENLFLNFDNFAFSHGEKDQLKVSLISRLSEIYEELNRYSDAIKMLELLIELNSYKNINILKCAFIYEKIGNYELAIDNFNKLIEMGEKVYLERAKNFLKLNKYREAFSDLEKIATENLSVELQNEYIKLQALFGNIQVPLPINKILGNLCVITYNNQEVYFNEKLIKKNFEFEFLGGNPIIHVELEKSQDEFIVKKAEFKLETEFSGKIIFKSFEDTSIILKTNFNHDDISESKDIFYIKVRIPCEKDLLDIGIGEYFDLYNYNS